MTTKYTDSEFWEILDFTFLEGKPFSENNVKDADKVAVINRKIRDEYFDGKPAYGKYITIGREKYRVIGVVENVPILRIMPYSDVWFPYTNSAEDINEDKILGGFPGWFAMILAKSKEDFPAIQKEFLHNVKKTEQNQEEYKRILTNASSYGEAFARQLFLKETGNIKPFLLIIYLLIFLFLVLPAINLVNINLSRIMERSSEIGIRKSYGASSLTLIIQFLIENIIITVIGGIISLVFAGIILSIINSTSIIPFSHFAINFRVFLFAMIVAVFFGVISGVYPAYRMSKLEPADALQEGVR